MQAVPEKCLREIRDLMLPLKVKMAKLQSELSDTVVNVCSTLEEYPAYMKGSEEYEEVKGLGNCLEDALKDFGSSLDGVSDAISHIEDMVS